jgi:3-isopropylmalate/(R)-2-methylmalate dehydratase small subunit
VLPTSDIDTDQIIAARFLTTTTREGLGAKLFYDLRHNSDGSLKEAFPLNDPATKGAEILVAGRNFGCGSSREHAPWALLDYGFKAVISTEIADIFRSNALKNGLVPVLVNAAVHERLLQQPGIELLIDLEQCLLTLPDNTAIPFTIDAFARYCLVEGIDQLGYLCQQRDAIEHFEKTRSWTP